MPNKLITADEAAESILESINKAAEKYIEESGCTEEEAEKVKIDVLNDISRSLFYGSMPR